MLIILKNGGKTSEFECKFKETEIIYYPNGKVEYKLSKDDVNSHFQSCTVSEYQAKYDDEKTDLLEYYIYFCNNAPYLDVRNKANDNSVTFRLKLTKPELNKIKSITRL